jgi:hypothetical protein
MGLSHKILIAQLIKTVAQDSGCGLSRVALFECLRQQGIDELGLGLLKEIPEADKSYCGAPQRNTRGRQILLPRSGDLA